MLLRSEKYFSICSTKFLSPSSGSERNQWNSFDSFFYILSALLYKNSGIRETLICLSLVTLFIWQIVTLFKYLFWEFTQMFSSVIIKLTATMWAGHQLEEDTELNLLKPAAVTLHRNLDIVRSVSECVCVCVWNVILWWCFLGALCAICPEPPHGHHDFGHQLCPGDGLWLHRNTGPTCILF